MDRQKLSYNKGLVLLEGALVIGATSLFVSMLVGVWGKLIMYQELDAKLSYVLEQVKGRFVINNSYEIQTLFVETLKDQKFDKYRVGVSIVRLENGIAVRDEFVGGNIQDYGTAQVRTNEQIINSRMLHNSEGVKDRYSQFWQNKYLENSLPPKNMSTKYLVIRLLVRPERSLLSHLEVFGWSSELYFERIIQLAK